MSTFIAAVSHASAHRSSALILAILGVFVLFLSYAIGARTAGVDPDEQVDVDPLAEPAELAEQEWRANEVRRARLARRLRPVLILLSTALVASAILVALLA